MIGKVVLHRFTSPEGRFAFMALFLVSVFVMGGGSRDDIQSLPILRPIAVLFSAYALSLISWDQFKRLGWSATLLLALITTMLIQLVPMPAAIWTSLPQRDLVTAIELSMELESPWRPLTLSPSKTLNSLFSLTVPLAAMLLFAIQSSKYREYTLILFLVMSVFSSVSAFVQLAGDPDGPLYLYHITNHGSGVGLYANRNHQGVFLASSILLIAYFFRKIDPRKDGKGLRSASCAMALLIVLPAVILSGSRAGIAVAALAIIASIYQFFKAPLILRAWNFGGKRSMPRRITTIVLGILSFVIAPLAFVFLRSNLSDRVVAESAVENLRYELLPLFWKMIVDFFPFGSGFGSFEYVYKIYERVENMNPRYLNLAHNDLAQFIIEGGAVGLALIFAFMVCFVRSIVLANRSTISQQQHSKAGREALAGWVIIFFAMASLFDYPLRVPSLMAYFAILCAMVARSGHRPRL